MLREHRVSRPFPCHSHPHDLPEVGDEFTAPLKTPPNTAAGTSPVRAARPAKVFAWATA